MLALHELESASRELMAINPRISAKAILITLKLSENPSSWFQLSKLHEDATFKPISSSGSYLRRLEGFSYIESKKENDTWYVKLKSNTALLNESDFDFDVCNNIKLRLEEFHYKHSDCSPLIVLVLIAIYVRKLPTTNIIERFIGNTIKLNSSALDTIKNLASLGYIQLIKDGEYQKATVYVFEVEQ